MVRRSILPLATTKEGLPQPQPLGTEEDRGPRSYLPTPPKDGSSLVS